MSNSKPPPPLTGNNDITTVSTPWTQREVDLLHEMVQDYDRAKWLRGQLKWWAIWLLGLPTAIVAIWEPLAKIGRFIKGGE